MRILLFAGTSEGRTLSEYLYMRGLRFSVCVATEYAKEYLSKGIEVLTGRKDSKEVERLISSGRYTLVLDATHPYADIATKNIKLACDALKVRYVRVLRESQALDGNCIAVDSIQGAIDYLQGTTGNVLLTTGVKNLKDYTTMPNYQDRLYARVLDNVQSIEECKALGYEHTILSSGACTVATNVSHLETANAKYLVTKESGSVGGFPEKLEACKLLNVTPIVVLRPKEPEGLSLQGTIAYLDTVKDVHIVGIGMGNVHDMPASSMEAIQGSEVLIGARRMVDTFSYLGKEAYVSYDHTDISTYIDGGTYRNVCVLMSGDTGFFSGTSLLRSALEERHNVTVHSGISCVSYLSSRVGVPWNASKILSNHGTDSNYVSAISRNAHVFLLTSGNVSKICEELLYYELSNVDVVVGENLSQEGERIRYGKPKDFLNVECSTLSTMYVYNPKARDIARFGIPDSEYARGSVPMTKSEVRAVSVSKCQVSSDSVCWDVGAGTGSVTVELALQCPNGKVFAIEKNHEGVGLIKENCRRFRTSNVETLEGNAEDILPTLSDTHPDVVFIGGSSGQLSQVLDVALTSNPYVRVVLDCITLDTLNLALEYVRRHGIGRYDVTQVAITRTHRVGDYNMLKAENPVYVVSFGGV